MKKVFTLAMAILLCSGLMCSCTFDSTSESEPYFEEMMGALSAGDIETATALMHVDAAENATTKTSLQTIVDYLAGRKMVQFQRTSINISNSFSTAGTTKREQATYQVTLEDDTVVTISYTYSNGYGDNGFLTIQLSFRI